MSLMHLWMRPGPLLHEDLLNLVKCANKVTLLFTKNLLKFYVKIYVTVRDGY